MNHTTARDLYISGPDLYSYSFAASEPKAHMLIQLLFDFPGSMLSKENAFVEEEDGKIRGLILAYPASAMRMQAVQSMKSL